MKFKRLAALGLAGVMMASIFTGCGLDKNETIATLGDQSVRLGVANFLCRYQQATYDDMFMAYVGEGAWSQDLYGNGVAMEDTIKTNTMEMLHTYYTLEAHMDDYGVSISDEQRAEIAEVAANFINANSEEALEELGAEQDVVEEMLTLYTIYNIMWNEMIADVDTNVSDEEANMRGYSLIRIDTSAEDADLEALNNTADAVLAVLNGGDAEEVDTEDAEAEEVEAEDAETEEVEADETESEDAESEDAESDEEKSLFETVAESFGLVSFDSTYAADDADIDETVKAALDGLKVGDDAVKVEIEGAIYIVQITTETDEEATEANREKILQARKDEKFSDLLMQWQTDDGWTVDEEVLAKIKFDDYFTTIDEGAVTEE